MCRAIWRRRGPWALSFRGKPKTLLLPAVATDLYLQALEKQNFNVFAPELQGGGFSTTVVSVAAQV